MSGRKSKKRIGSTRRPLGQKTGDRGAEEVPSGETILQESPEGAENAGRTGDPAPPTATLEQASSDSSEMPKCKLDSTTEEVHMEDPGKTDPGEAETREMKRLSGADENTSGKIRRMGSSRRGKQRFQLEDRMEDHEEVANSMPALQEESNVIVTTDEQCLTGNTDLPEVPQSSVVGSVEGEEMMEKTEEHRLLSEQDLTTDAENSRSNTNSLSQSFSDSCAPDSSVNVIDTHDNEQENVSQKQDGESFQSMADGILSGSSHCTISQDALGEHQQQHEIHECDEQKEVNEVSVVVTAHVDATTVKGNLEENVSHAESCHIDKQPVETDHEFFKDVTVEAAAINNFSVQTQDKPQDSASQAVASMSENEEHLQICADAESYNTSGHQQVPHIDQTSSSTLTHEDELMEDVHRPKKRMGSTRRPLKGSKFVQNNEDISQLGAETKHESTIESPEITEETLSVKEDTQRVEMAELQFTLDMATTVCVREIEAGGSDEIEEQDIKQMDPILSDNMEHVSHTESPHVTDDSGSGATSSSQFVIEASLDNSPQINEEHTNINQQEVVVETLHLDPSEGPVSVWQNVDEETLQTSIHHDENLTQERTQREDECGAATKVIESEFGESKQVSVETLMAINGTDLCGGDTELCGGSQDGQTKGPVPVGTEMSETTTALHEQDNETTVTLQKHTAEDSVKQGAPRQKRRMGSTRRKNQQVDSGEETSAKDADGDNSIRALQITSNVKEDSSKGSQQVSTSHVLEENDNGIVSMDFVLVAHEQCGEGSSSAEVVSSLAPVNQMEAVQDEASHPHVTAQQPGSDDDLNPDGQQEISILRQSEEEFAKEEVSENPKDYAHTTEESICTITNTEPAHPGSTDEFLYEPLCASEPEYPSASPLSDHTPQITLNVQTESLNLPLDTFDMGSLHEHVETTLKHEDPTEEGSFEQAAPQQKRKMGSTRRSKRQVDRAEEGEGMGADEDNAIKDASTHIDAGADIAVNLDKEDSVSQMVQADSEPQLQAKHDEEVSQDLNTDFGDIDSPATNTKPAHPELLNEALLVSEPTAEHASPFHISEHTPETTQSPLNVQTESFSLNLSTDTFDTGTLHIHHTEEGSVEQAAPRQKRKMGSTRRSKRHVDRAEEDEGTAADEDHAIKDASTHIDTGTDITEHSENSAEPLVNQDKDDSVNKNISERVDLVEHKQCVEVSSSTEVVSSLAPVNQMEAVQDEDSHPHVTAQQPGSDDDLNPDGQQETSILRQSEEEFATVEENIIEAFAIENIYQPKKPMEEISEGVCDAHLSQSQENSIAKDASEQADNDEEVSENPKHYAHTAEESICTITNTEPAHPGSTDEFLHEPLCASEPEYPSASLLSDHTPQITLNIQTESLNLPVDTSDTGTLHEHDEPTLKHEDRTEESSVEQAAPCQKRKMGSTRRSKRQVNRAEEGESMTAEEESSIKDVSTHIAAGTDITVNLDKEDRVSQMVLVDSEPQLQAEHDEEVSQDLNTDFGDIDSPATNTKPAHPELLNEALFVSEPTAEHPSPFHISEHTPETTQSPLDVQTESFSLNLPRDTFSTGTLHVHHTEEGSVEQAAPRQKRKMGSTRRSKRHVDRAEEDEGTAADEDHAIKDASTHIDTGTDITEHSENSAEPLVNQDKDDSVNKNISERVDLVEHKQCVEVSSSTEVVSSLAPVNQMEAVQDEDSHPHVTAQQPGSDDDLNPDGQQETSILRQSEEEFATVEENIIEAFAIENIYQPKKPMEEISEGVCDAHLSQSQENSIAKDASEQADNDEEVSENPKHYAHTAEESICTITNTEPAHPGSTDEFLHEPLCASEPEYPSASLLSDHTPEITLNIQTESLNLPVDTSDMGTLHEHDEPTLKHEDRTEESSVEQAAPRQKRKMGSTRRSKRQVNRAEEGESMAAEEESSIKDVSTHIDAGTDIKVNLDKEDRVSQMVQADSEPQLQAEHDEEVSQDLNTDFGDIDSPATNTKPAHPELLNEALLVSEPTAEHPSPFHISEHTPETTQSPLNVQTESFSLNLPTDTFSTGTLNVHHTEEGSVEQASPRQKRKMGSTRRAKRHMDMAEEGENMGVNDDHAIKNASTHTDADTDVTEHSETTAESLVNQDKEDSINTNISEQVDLTDDPRLDCPGNKMDMKDGPENSDDVENSNEAEQVTTSHISTISTMSTLLISDSVTKASEFLQGGCTEKAESHSSNSEGHDVTESIAMSDQPGLPSTHQLLTPEGDLEQNVSRPKRKMGSTRRQKRQSNDVDLDKGMKSSHESEGMNWMGTSAEMSLQPDIHSEQISTCEEIQSACLDTTPVDEVNEYEPQDVSESLGHGLINEDVHDNSSWCITGKNTEEPTFLMVQTESEPQLISSLDQNDVNIDADVAALSQAAQAETEGGQCQEDSAEEHAQYETDINKVQRREEDKINGEAGGKEEIHKNAEPERHKFVLKQEMGETQMMKDSSPSDSQADIHMCDRSSELTETAMENLSLEKGVSASLYQETEGSPSVTRRRKMGSSRRHRNQQETAERKCVVMDGMLMCAATDISSCPANESLDGKTEETQQENILHEEEHKEAMPSISVNTLSESITASQDRSCSELRGKDELSKTEQDVLATSIAVVQVPLVDSDSSEKDSMYEVDDKSLSSDNTHLSQLESTEQRHVTWKESQVHTATAEQSEMTDSIGIAAAEETDHSKLCPNDDEEAPKSPLQKRKIGSSRRGQGLGKRGKRDVSKVHGDTDIINTESLESHDKTCGALDVESSEEGDSSSVTPQDNTKDLPVEGEQPLGQTGEGELQEDKPEESIDKQELSAAVQDEPSVLTLLSPIPPEGHQDNPTTDPQTTSIKKRKMGSTRRNTRRQDGEEKSDFQTAVTKRPDDDNSSQQDVAIDTVTVTEIRDLEDSRPTESSAGLDTAGQTGTPQATRRKMGSRRAGQGYRGIGVHGEPEDQAVGTDQGGDSSISPMVQEKSLSESGAEGGPSKVTPADETDRRRPVEQPAPSTANRKSDLDRLHGQDYTLTSLEEAIMFNVVMVGESSVGKTSFVKRLMTGQYSEDHSATIGVDTFIQTLAVDGQLVKLQIWDTAGQERFHSITRQVLNKAQGLILMYDISSCQTFSAVRRWISCVEEGAPREVIIMLLGNKSDSKERQVLPPEGERLAQEYNIHFMECSAATGYNVSVAMENLARLLKQSVKYSGNENLSLHKPQQKKSGCC
ncbi:uncharacterized protein LOC134462452 [Engraulis encrasicolus]|uniref:uncharacterized protein LOC134462452 n=1 Tax=Engraulis encrasicolus TaxID=184585 RepID=UPI002FCEEFE7